MNLREWQLIVDRVLSLIVCRQSEATCIQED